MYISLFSLKEKKSTVDVNVSDMNKEIHCCFRYQGLKQDTLENFENKLGLNLDLN